MSIVDLHYGYLIHFQENQLSFTDVLGCNKTIFACTKTVRYFRNRHSNVYLAVLDVTKAFNRFNQFNSLQRLLECGFPLKLVNVFYQWYRNMKSCILWKNSISKFLALSLVVLRALYWD